MNKMKHIKIINYSSNNPGKQYIGHIFIFESLYTSCCDKIHLSHIFFEYFFIKTSNEI